MSDRLIQPIAWQPHPNCAATLYRLAFPPEWKNRLLDIFPRKDSRSNLPTGALKDMILAWMPQVTDMAPLSSCSDDRHWLTSLSAFSPDDLNQLCGILAFWLKTAVNSRNCSHLRWDPASLLQTVLNSPQTLHQECETVPLFDRSGLASAEAFRVVPLLLQDRLMNRSLACMHLNRITGRNRSRIRDQELISDPLTDPRTGHSYSFIFRLRLETIPPHQRPMLLCHMGIRRWIPGPEQKRETYFLPYDISAHIRVSPDRFCVVPLGYDRKAKAIVWQQPHVECYRLWNRFSGGPDLPTPEELQRNVADWRTLQPGHPQILLPYRNGIDTLGRSSIGTGVPMPDRVRFTDAISTCLDGFADPWPKVSSVPLRNLRPETWNPRTPLTSASPAPVEQEAFRQAFQQATGQSRITIELYTLQNDPQEQAVLQNLQKILEQDFGPNRPGSCLELTIRSCSSAPYVAPLASVSPRNHSEAVLTRSKEVLEDLKPAREFTACLFVLQNVRSSPSDGGFLRENDPKQALRLGFACSSRLVQFLTPKNPGEPSQKTEQNPLPATAEIPDPFRLRSAVLDLYRQCGLVAPLTPKGKTSSTASLPCIALHPLAVRLSKGNLTLPLWVYTDLSRDIIRVHCDAFQHPDVSYPQACREMAALYERLCRNPALADSVSRTPVRDMLQALKARHPDPAHGILMMVQAGEPLSPLWSGTTNRAISLWPCTDEASFCPEEIEAGTRLNSARISLKGSGVRIIRLRTGEEVPDYLTGLSRKATEANRQYMSVSGVFRHNSLFWSIRVRPNDDRFKRESRQRREDYPGKSYAHIDMVELYPLQLQPQDTPEEWVGRVHALCGISIQYKDATVLPLPLHLAGKLEEYLFHPLQTSGR